MYAIKTEDDYHRAGDGEIILFHFEDCAENEAALINFISPSENCSVVERPKPCPFCGSHNLREIDIWLATDDGDETLDAIECLDCDAQARADLWNNRPEAA